MPPLAPRETIDFLVLGGGVAGLSFALEAAGRGSVLVLTKRHRSEGSTQYAQGGIASVLGPDDDFQKHVDDTLVAGAGLCHRDAVEVTVREGPERIRWLLSLGVELDREGGALHLTREGGHSRRRVAHAKDTTGREVERALLAACDARGVRIVEDQVAVDLVSSAKLGLPGANRVLGAYVLDRASGEVSTVIAGQTVLATGGAGKVYLYTSNPDVATGDGVAMAWRAGADVANMEFFQFHPTCLYHPLAKSFLISEALRGEGGILRNGAGEAFMARYDPRKELAPRDIVARSIDAEMKRRGDESAFLDMTHLPKHFLLEHFPNIYATCREFGIDMAVQPIPVVPAAHYLCGGVVTDLAGQTSLPGLLAIGEVSCTGLHGANRLASNSLLEGLVFGHRAALSARPEDRGADAARVPAWNPGDALDPDEGVVVTQNWDEVRRLMWNYVGIVRTEKRLARAHTRLELLRGEIRDYYWQYKLTPDLVELRNLADVAALIVACARRRKESRGLHFLLDHPKPDDRELHDTVVRPGELD
ncbi:L-aspartate oxidase [Anaeromyxobacter paludicola]|uniref:L-aspartate oxidase n=1 Tax=Anaeromyxobacter paludicola TaxID=2918171 RepID=A0ABM7XAJ5_9BACT|nr:L-aspartate oxidase [Anaeromyxobacter paludicola]BDG08860.1 L-aspartate oxidase [Anaeromyxobacter paludicola]